MLRPKAHGHSLKCRSLMQHRGGIVHTINPCTCDRENPVEPYFVELQDDWKIVKPGGNEQLDSGWPSKVKAQEVCDWLNDAFDLGRASA